MKGRAGVTLAAGRFPISCLNRIGLALVQRTHWCTMLRVIDFPFVIQYFALEAANNACGPQCRSSS